METLSLNHKAPRPKSHQKWLEVPLIRSSLQTEEGRADPWLNEFTIPNPECLSGILYGDAVLVYALTWTKYPSARGVGDSTTAK